MVDPLAKNSVRVGNENRGRGTGNVLSVVEGNSRDPPLRLLQVHKMLSVGRDVVHDENAGSVVHDPVVVYEQTTAGHPGSHSEEEFRFQHVNETRTVRHGV